MSLMTDAGSFRLVDVVAIVREGRLLLVEYERAPGRRAGWTMPSVEVDYGEDPQEVARALVGGLGLDPGTLTLDGVRSSLGGTGWMIRVRWRLETDLDPPMAEGIKRHEWVEGLKIPKAANMAFRGVDRSEALLAMRLPPDTPDPPGSWPVTA